MEVVGLGGGWGIERETVRAGCQGKHTGCGMCSKKDLGVIWKRIYFGGIFFVCFDHSKFEVCL